MHHDFPDIFSTLREEFRLLQSGFRPKSTMPEQAMNSSWLTTAPLNASNGRTEANPFVGSSSSYLSPFISSKSSHSFVESEGAQSEAAISTVVSGPDDLAAPLQQNQVYTAENGENSLAGSRVQHRSRKGHKKSRVGCFNCKRRKIKVCVNPKSIRVLTQS
jgi:hypothetical protein